jgi:hypothetical protein
MFRACWIAAGIVFILGFCLLFVGCAHDGVNSTLTYQYRASNVVIRASIEIPSTITASNLVVTWKPMSGEVDYKADYITRSNEGVVKLTAERDVKILDSTGRLVGVIAEGVVKGAVKGVVP